MMGGDLFKWEYLIGPPVFLLLLFLAMLLHEMGHFALARMFKMPVKSVVIGRGRTLKYWHDKHDTRWSLRLWPLGAYVQLAGWGEEEPGEDAFVHCPFWQRLTTILAGPFANFFILPFLFFTFYLAVGQPSTPPVLAGVEKGLVSDKAGLKPGDRFVAVDGIPVTNTSDIWRVLYSKEVAQSEILIDRNGQARTFKITPDWIEYHDDHGVPRKNARFGVVWQHAPFKLSAVMSVNGTDTRDDEERTRKLLIQNLDRDVVLGLKGPDGKPGLTKVHLFKQANLGLLDKKSENYTHVFLGATRGNVYLRKSAREQALNALRYSAGLIKKTALIPFQLLPIDSTAIHDENAVTNADTWWLNKLYAVIHLFALTSVAIGLVNLLPFPHLDGGHILVQAIERARKHRLSRKAKAKIFALAFLAFYAAVMISNMDNVPGYIDSRLKKVHEFIKNNTLPDEEG